MIFPLQCGEFTPLQRTAGVSPPWAQKLTAISARFDRLNIGVTSTGSLNFNVPAFQLRGDDPTVRRVIDTRPPKQVSTSRPGCRGRA